MTNTRAIVTGAHGFIGRHAARRLAELGYEVAGIGHGSWDRCEWQEWGLQHWHATDVSLSSLVKHAELPAIIVHCAGSGSVSFSFQNPLQDFNRTVLSTVGVLEYVRSVSPATKIVYPSSAGVYGVAETLPIAESTACDPISPYGVHKLIAENMISSYCYSFGIAACIVRYFSIFGCGLRKQLLWESCQKLSVGDNNFMGTGLEVRDWLHIDDAVELLVVAKEHASSLCPIVNGGTGEGTTVREILNYIATLTAPVGVVPNFSDRKREGDPASYVANITRAIEWGWAPSTHWRSKIRAYVDWWHKENARKLASSLITRA